MFTSSAIRTREELSALITPVKIKLSSITIPVESSDLIMFATRSPSMTTLPVPLGDIVISVFVNVELMVLPFMSMALPVESCPCKSYNSSKLLLIFIIAALNVSPVPEFSIPI